METAVSHDGERSLQGTIVALLAELQSRRDNHVMLHPSLDT